MSAPTYAELTEMVAAFTGEFAVLTQQFAALEHKNQVLTDEVVALRRQNAALHEEVAGLRQVICPLFLGQWGKLVHREEGIGTWLEVRGFSRLSSGRKR